MTSGGAGPARWMHVLGAVLVIGIASFAAALEFQANPPIRVFRWFGSGILLSGYPTNVKWVSAGIAVFAFLGLVLALVDSAASKPVCAAVGVAAVVWPLVVWMWLLDNHMTAKYVALVADPRASAGLVFLMIGAALLVMPNLKATSWAGVVLLPLIVVVAAMAISPWRSSEPGTFSLGAGSSTTYPSGSWQPASTTHATTTPAIPTRRRRCAPPETSERIISPLACPAARELPTKRAHGATDGAPTFPPRQTAASA